MLKSLYIKDYALIDEIFVEFERGFNVILGETGAGKSILIGALGLLIGERASSEIIRKGTKKAIVEGIFEISEFNDLKKILEEIDIDFDDELIIRREISAKGSNRIFLNDTPATLADIKTLGDLLVDLHGQHSHQSLLKSEKHIEFLDELGEYSNELTEFAEKVEELEGKIRERENLIKREKELAEKLELYEFKLNEINDVNPDEGEDEKLEAELRILENSEFLFNSANELYELLYNSDGAVYDRLSEAERKISELIRYDEKFRAHADDLASALSAIAEIAEFMREYKDNLELDPEIIEEKRERLGAINLLKKKYGPTLEAVLSFRDEIAREISLAQNFSDEIKKLDDAILNLRTEAGKIAEKISSGRKNAAARLEPLIAGILKNLGMSDAKFTVKFDLTESENVRTVVIYGKSYAYNSRGVDSVEFLISANAGEEPKPLAKVASGGEISRIMLALKTLLAEKDAIPLLIFDEIDAGISGRIAQKVGQAMFSLAKSHQIIAITHLPQIAAFAENHYLIEKKKEDDRAVSRIKKLSEKETPEEIAKLFSGEKVTETALRNAEELLLLAAKEKALKN